MWCRETAQKAGKNRLFIHYTFKKTAVKQRFCRNKGLTGAQRAKKVLT
jgi:hypothetical protein